MYGKTVLDWQLAKQKLLVFSFSKTLYEIYNLF